MKVTKFTGDFCMIYRYRYRGSKYAYGRITGFSLRSGTVMVTLDARKGRREVISVKPKSIVY